MLELQRVYWTRQAIKSAYLAATVWLLASAVMALIPDKGATIEGQGISAVTATLWPMFDRVLGAVAVPGVFVVVLAIVAVVLRTRDLRRRDSVRRFTRQQRREGMARAGGQCEMEAGFRRRCSRPAEHGDHFYPWSKGGSTSLLNFVAACAPCNRAKGARLPSPGQQARIERRRRTYVAPDGSVSVGERQPVR
jgi:hypothetical protein